MDLCPKQGYLADHAIEKNLNLFTLKHTSSEDRKKDKM